MLAGCSCTLLSARHRLRSESPAQFQAFHFPSMSTQRLELPCSFPRKDTSLSQAIRPVGISVEKPIEAKISSCSLKQNIRFPSSPTTIQTAFIEARRHNKDEFWEKTRSLKRFADQGPLDDESSLNRAKRKKASGKSDDSPEDCRKLTLGQLGSGNFWFQPTLEVPRSVPLITGRTSPQVPFSVSCSGEEETICYVPSDVISPTLPSSNDPWVESVITELTDLGDKNVETSQGPVKEASGSSTSSESPSSGLNRNTSEHEKGNGSWPPNPNENSEAVAEDDNHHHELEAFELINFLIACVEAVNSKNIAAVHHFLSRLGALASPRGSPISRLTAYFTEAVALRVANVWSRIFHITTPRDLDRGDDDSSTSLRLLNQVSPIPKFIHFTSNEVLMRAFEGKDRGSTS